MQMSFSDKMVPYSATFCSGVKFTSRVCHTSLTLPFFSLTKLVLVDLDLLWKQQYWPNRPWLLLTSSRLSSFPILSLSHSFFLLQSLCPSKNHLTRDISWRCLILFQRVGKCNHFQDRLHFQGPLARTIRIHYTQTSINGHDNSTDDCKRRRALECLGN